MYKPIKSVAKDLNITRQGVQQRMKSIHNFKSKYTIIKKHKRLISNKGIHILENRSRTYKKSKENLHKNLLLHALLNDSKQKSIQINRLTIMLHEQETINANQNKQIQKLTYQPKHHTWLWKIFH